ncbi:MAG: M48 family metallopeptidase [Robiginitomaculum sp.]|nr:M48 family metallopeptidase [Robiginitomaculum sp.]
MRSLWHFTIMLFGAVIAITLFFSSAATAQNTIRDAEIESLMRQFSDPLFTAAGLNTSSVDIYIINDKTMNAFVTRGQKMFLHTGIILQAETPNELKGVIAHETAHISGGHLARSSDAISKASRPMILTMGLGVLAAVAGEPQAAMALLNSASQFGTLTFFTHSRIQEASADQAAANFLETSGQSGKGLIKFYERFRFQEVMSGARRFPYFRTHPLSSDRIDSLAIEVNAAKYADALDNKQEIFALEMVKAKIIGFLDKPQRVFLQYPQTDQSLPAKYARAIAYYQEASTKQALEKIAELIELQPENPYFNELYGQVLFESGKSKQAVYYHQKSVDLAPASPLLHLNLAQALVATNTPENLKLAKEHLDFVIRYEPGNSFAWYQVSILHEKAGEFGLAKLATAEQAYAMHDYFRALSFAGRAKQDLQPNTPQWRRANDILLVIAADPQIRKYMRSSKGKGGH